MIDHFCIVSKPELMEATIAFYTAVLGPLGYKRRLDMFESKLVGFGENEACAPDFWISVEGLNASTYPVTQTHFAFAAQDQVTVAACYDAGLAAGGVDNGKPGLRPQYSPMYYGAFLRDPNGNGFEIVNKDGKTG